MQLKLLARTLEDVRQEDGQTKEEFWFALDIWEVFGYKTWEEFKPAFERAKESCATSGVSVDNNFHVVQRPIQRNGKSLVVTDYRLTRYACYIIAQNGDPRIREVAFTQMYFAKQTRRQEELQKNIEEIERLYSREKLSETEREFEKTIYEHGVRGNEFAEIKNAGDQALFDGYTTSQMKSRLGLPPKGKALADALPTVTLKAKDLATEMTTLNTKTLGLYGKDPIKYEHISNNEHVRGALVRASIFPENLPAAEDVSKIKERHEVQKKFPSNQPIQKSIF